MHNGTTTESVDRLIRVFAGALDIWGVTGKVVLDGCTLLVDSEEGVHLAVHHDAARGWTVATRDPVSGARTQIAEHAGLPGVLRTMRIELAPDAPAGRMIVGRA